MIKICRRIEMNANFIVMIVVLVIWIGIFLYLLGLDNKLKRIEKKDES
ncbi:MAG: CcmD family protein [Candidatus Zixiibacteriota bacterium]|nr:MAG: CcmD family protein [candidate division Zixibacteria bacterium]